MTGLTKNTSFVFRVYASDPGTSTKGWSPAVSFTTLYEDPPPLMGSPIAVPHLISQTAATLECELQQGAADVTLVWALEDQGESSIASWTGAAGGGSQAFPDSGIGEVLSHGLTGLSHDTSYAFRFFATNAFGDDWSETGAFTTRPKPDLSSGLVAYYPLDDGSGLTATDTAGGNHGTLNGNVVWTGAGKLGGGLEFTRTSRDSTTLGAPYVNGWVSANGLMSNGVLKNTGSYTFSAWIKLDLVSGASFGYVIFGANTTSGGNIFRIGVDEGGDNIFSHLTSNLGTTTTFDETWVLYTMAMDSTGNADFYLNGTLALTKVADPTAEREGVGFGTANLFHFGMEMEQGKATDGWSGTMDELAIWNRELTATEVFLLYNSGEGIDPSVVISAGMVIVLR